MNKILQEKIKKTITNPDLMNKKCPEHIFYVKKIEKETVIVFVQKRGKKYSVECMDYLVKP